MTSMGTRMTSKEFAMMAREADSDGDGLINYRGNHQVDKCWVSYLAPEFCSLLCDAGEGKNEEKKKKKARLDRRRRVKEEMKDGYSSNSRNGSFSQG